MKLIFNKRIFQQPFREHLKTVTLLYKWEMAEKVRLGFTLPLFRHILLHAVATRVSIKIYLLCFVAKLLVKLATSCRHEIRTVLRLNTLEL